MGSVFAVDVAVVFVPSAAAAVVDVLVLVVFFVMVVAVVVYFAVAVSAFDNLPSGLAL